MALRAGNFTTAVKGDFFDDLRVMGESFLSVELLNEAASILCVTDDLAAWRSAPNFVALVGAPSNGEVALEVEDKSAA
jgi:hypothetical protein